VGTKTELARRLGRFDSVGQDLVAMCADDVVCHGAAPRYFLDYIAVGRLDAQRVSQLVVGIADACAEIGCELIGGETAEHPGVMREDDFDMAGFCIGIAERDELVDASMSRAGDVIIGLASSGLHSNGFSLVRQLVDDGRLPLTDDLLTPTRLYARVVLDMVTAVRGRGLRVGGLAHITGGGLVRNLPRAVGEDLAVIVDPGAWQVPPVIVSVARAADLTSQEMRATFNAGIGFACVLEPEAAPVARDAFAAHGIESWLIGEVRPAGGDGAARYLEA
jgi:phosphoribosylformylglycinamidine cyclo-ligase